MHKRLLALTLTLAILLSIPLQARIPVVPVMPLHNEAGQNFCTAFAINKAANLWATAGHCVAAAAKRNWTILIAGQKAELIYIAFDEQRDFAVLRVVGVEPDYAFPLAAKSPERCEITPKGKNCPEVFVVGYPYGLPVLSVTKGVIAARNVPIGANAPVSDILSVQVAGGNSGSPVLNERGEVVGILWGMFTESPHSLSIPHETIKRDIGRYFGAR